ncbi:MAG: N-acetyl-gamma-glutamyl-phosphate reductase [Bacillota bacterium]
MRVGIVGVTGYTGSELLRIIHTHGRVELTYVTSHSFTGKKLAEVHPQYSGLVNLTCRPFSVAEAVEKTDLVFCALPHGEAMEVVPLLSDAGVRVVDLSADFRLLDEMLYREWYQKEHSSPAYLARAVYGLPELYREEIKQACLVANPGCYPTSVILALAPLASKRLVRWETLVVDAKSGTSGAGRNPSQLLHFPECAENFRAYRVAAHQHTPEMEQELGRLAGENISITFVPHLVPMIRGILSTLYLKLTVDLEEDELWTLYKDFYNGERFVRLLPPPLLVETKYVYGSNYCALSLKKDRRTGRVIILSALDNLVKGAAGQAVQNMNLMLGFTEEKGLEMLPLRP